MKIRAIFPEINFHTRLKRSQSLTIALEVASKTNKQLLDEGPVLFIVPATWQSLITMEAAAATKYQTDPFFPQLVHISALGAWWRLGGWLVWYIYHIYGMVWYSWVVNKAALMGGNNWEGGTPEVASDDQVIGRSSGFFHAGKVLRDFCQNIHRGNGKNMGKVDPPG